MRPRRRLVSLFLNLALVVWATVGGAADGGGGARTLVIRVNPSDPWGGRVEDVEKVLSSTAMTLWKYFPDRELPPILVAPKGGPITLYKRGPAGEIQVRLNTGNRLWAQ